MEIDPKQPTSSRTAEERVAFALQLIEHAQFLVNSAAGEICSVRHMGDEWDQAPEIERQLKSWWHAITRRRRLILEHAAVERKFSNSNVPATLELDE